GSAALAADRCDEVGCLLWEVPLRRPAGAPAGDPRAWAGRLTARVTGLLEPLRLVEVDEARNEALLRSEEPGRKGGDQFYYEVLLRGARAAELRRYRAARPDARREQVAFALTHEALAKLALDCTAVRRGRGPRARPPPRRRGPPAARLPPLPLPPPSRRHPPAPNRLDGPPRSGLQPITPERAGVTRRRRRDREVAMPSRELA